MKKLMILSSVTLLLGINSVMYDTNIVDLDKESKLLFTPVKNLAPPVPRVYQLNMGRFTSLLGCMESLNDYTVVNRFGYMGKYQFSKTTLKALRSKGYLQFTDIELHQFTSNPPLQERAIIALVNHNDDYFKRGKLYEYVGKRVKGILLTREGMLAGAHLVGPYAVKQFIYSNGRVNKRDGNKTPVSKYIYKFSG